MAWDKTIPLLQDSLYVNVMNRYAINHNDIVILDSGGRVWKQVTAAPAQMDLLQAAWRDTLARWVREAP
jgi:hypothetical protein